jgi:hypothetical protein
MKTASWALRRGIEYQTRFVEEWKGSGEVLLFETVRAIDYTFCRVLFGDEYKDDTDRRHHMLLTWGTNKALRRVMPGEFAQQPFRMFASRAYTQEPTDSLLLHCGILERAELLEELHRDGLLSGHVEVIPREASADVRNILVLKTAHPSLFREIIAHEHRRWMSELIIQNDRQAELDLISKHEELLPEIDKHLLPVGDWGMAYTSTPEIDAYFLEWATLYLRRFFGSDILGLDDRIGGRSFSEYLRVLTALSMRCQKHLYYARRMKDLHPQIDLRNLLTAFSGYDELLVRLATFLDTDTLYVQQLLGPLTLEPTNSATHLNRRETVWAPVIRSSADHCLLPIYGLDINPFLFLMRDLADKYPADWSRLANTREPRWRAEFANLFASPRWSIAEKSVNLRDGKTTVTDIDQAVYDSDTNELTVFQLKWQLPVGPGASRQARVSFGKNFVSESNKWLGSVFSWFEKYGAPELAKRLGLSVRSNPSVQCFVIARYNAHFSGFADMDRHATWVDWVQFVRGRYEQPGSPLSELATFLSRQSDEMASAYGGDNDMFPLGDTAVILNPISVPRRSF